MANREFPVPNLFIKTGYLSNGTAALPALTFEGDQNTGIFLNSANIIGFSCNGVASATLSATNFDITNISTGSGLYSSSNSGYPIILKGNDTSDGSGYAVKIQNVVALTTAGDKLLGIFSDAGSTERAFFDKDGILYNSTLLVNSTGTVAIVNDSADAGENNAGWLYVGAVNGTKYRIPVWTI